MCSFESCLVLFLVLFVVMFLALALVWFYWLLPDDFSLATLDFCSVADCARLYTVQCRRQVRWPGVSFDRASGQTKLRAVAR